MRICFLADARSPIARNWISYFVDQGHDVHVISSYPCSWDAIPGARLYVLPIAFAGFLGHSRKAASSVEQDSQPVVPHRLRIRGGHAYAALASVRHWLVPLELRLHTRKGRHLVELIRPDLLHALRIPYEGIFSAMVAGDDVPLLLSAWGNDFTMFAHEYPLVGKLTRRALKRANGLLCDCNRDLKLAERWGFDSTAPSGVLPGAGGVRRDMFYPGRARDRIAKMADLPQGTRVVINARGIRTYVRNDAFFRAIPQVLQECPQTVFLCVGMRGNIAVQRWTAEYGISQAVRLLPPVPYEEMPDLFRLARVVVSPSAHDGTPNTLLEGVACGCFPVAGDIESIREWIIDGENGLLCDPGDPVELARAMIRALRDDALIQQAREQNQSMIRCRADYTESMERALNFYHRVVKLAEYSRVART